MKKYLFGLIALTMVIAFSAFVAKGFAPKASTTNTTETALYWYPVNQGTNEIDHTALINPTSAKLTQTQLRDNDMIPCEEGSDSDCIRGFEELQTFAHADEGLEKVQKNDE
ncbi:MAG TPA: hypothetical protein PKE30_00735 [Niabella sp.]|nr:hypothetical protein [Niabella sp.]